MSNTVKHANALQRVQLVLELLYQTKMIFCEELSIDLILIENKAILHLVDIATRFSNAVFLKSEGETFGQPVDGIWSAFVMEWFNMYTG